MRPAMKGIHASFSFEREEQRKSHHRDKEEKGQKPEMIPIDGQESQITPNVQMLEKIREKLEERTVKERVTTC